MTDYQIEVGDSAECDLRCLSPDVVFALVTVMATTLRAEVDPWDADEGQGGGVLLWRRGVLRDAPELSDEDEDSGIDAAWNYVIIYRRFTSEEERRHRSIGFFIEGVKSNDWFLKHCPVPGQKPSAGPTPDIVDVRPFQEREDRF